MRDCHGLRGIRNQVACDQRIFHANMPHRNPIAYGNRGKLHRSAASRADTRFYSLGNFVEIHMARNNFIVGADYPDQWTLQLLLCVPQRIK